jgi:hypothetical protein
VDAGAEAPRPLALVLVLRLLLAEEADAGVPRLCVGLVRVQAGGGQVVAACRRFTSGTQAQAPSCTRHSRIRAVGPTRNRTSGGVRWQTGGQLLAAARVGFAAPGEGALRRNGQCVEPPQSTGTGDSTRGPTCSVMASPASSSADFLRNVPLPPSACAAAAATAASEAPPRSAAANLDEGGAVVTPDRGRPRTGNPVWATADGTRGWQRRPRPRRPGALVATGGRRGAQGARRRGRLPCGHAPLHLIVHDRAQRVGFGLGQRDTVILHSHCLSLAVIP